MFLKDDSYFRSPIRNGKTVTAHHCTAPCACAGYLLADFHLYHPAAQAWTNLYGQVSGDPPAARVTHGLLAAKQKVYVHAGRDASGKIWGSMGSGKEHKACMAVTNDFDLITSNLTGYLPTEDWCGAGGYKT